MELYCICVNHSTILQKCNAQNLSKGVFSSIELIYKFEREESLGS